MADIQMKRRLITGELTYRVTALPEGVADSAAGKMAGRLRIAQAGNRQIREVTQEADDSRSSFSSGSTTG